MDRTSDVFRTAQHLVGDAIEEGRDHLHEAASLAVEYVNALPAADRFEAVYITALALLALALALWFCVSVCGRIAGCCANCCTSAGKVISAATGKGGRHSTFSYIRLESARNELTTRCRRDRCRATRPRRG